MRASRHFPLRFLVVVIANILTTYADPTAFYFFKSKDDNGERMAFQYYPSLVPDTVFGELPSTWNLRFPTCLVIGDYFDDPKKAKSSSVIIKQALLKSRRECNIVLVDWYSDAGFGDLGTTWEKRAEGDVGFDAFNLRTVRRTLDNAFMTSVLDIAKQVSFFIHCIRSRVSPLEGSTKEALEVTAFAHGMGAQVIGFVAVMLRDVKVPPIQTIIATDPPSYIISGENFKNPIHASYLNKNSATRVISITTNANGFGSNFVKAHIIFHINNEYIAIEKDALDFSNVLSGAERAPSNSKIQVQPGYNKQGDGTDALFYSHNKAAEYLAEQIINPTQVTLEPYGKITLFGDEIEVKALPPDGLKIKLYWKKDRGPELVSSTYTVWAPQEEDVPILKGLARLTYKRVVESALPETKVECTTTTDSKPGESSQSTSTESASNSVIDMER